ncbi:MAG: dimethylmenaquinone methyltransferase [Actinobacteria bacterium]|jgi:4-hydroxy-4-methyl-2-oxoglutarate aldolase|nr:dimethylmenaquinone methyltransferase [Actinomycetota bacterium]
MSAVFTAERLLELGSATIGESGGLSMHPRLRPAWSGARLAAPAYTVQCSPGDNLAVHVAVTKAPEGSVLVVNVGDVAQRGYWGEVLTTAAETRRLAGLVIDGGVRDSAALESHRFPVFSSMIALRGATKCSRGTICAPVEVGGVTVSTGDWIVADNDGVVSIPTALTEDVFAAALARADKENGLFDALRRGETTVSLLGLDASLVEER